MSSSQVNVFQRLRFTDSLYSTIKQLNKILTAYQGRIQDLPKGWGSEGWTMASTELKPITEVWGRSPQRGPPCWGSAGRSPVEAESFLSIFMQKNGQKIRI